MHFTAIACRMVPPATSRFPDYTRRTCVFHTNLRPCLSSLGDVIPYLPTVLGAIAPRHLFQSGHQLGRASCTHLTPSSSSSLTDLGGRGTRWEEVAAGGAAWGAGRGWGGGGGGGGGCCVGAAEDGRGGGGGGGGGTPAGACTHEVGPRGAQGRHGQQAHCAYRQSEAATDANT